MKKLFLIISPYFFFCLLFSIPFIIRPTKHKDSNQKDENINKVEIDSSEIQNDSIIHEEVIPDNIEEELPQEYSIVVGSFKSKEKADKLKSKLQSLNFECSSQELENGLIRITVGSGYSELELQDDIDSLKKLGFQPWIINIGELASN